MLDNIRTRMASDEEGFTLVELLVVMLILGILAAIAIPSFFNQRDKANDSDAKAQVRTAQTAIETFATDNDGSYTGATVDGLQTIETTLNDVADADMTVTVTDAGLGYEISVVSSTDNEFEIKRNADGTTVYNCSTADSGGCPSSGEWAGAIGSST